MNIQASRVDDQAGARTQRCHALALALDCSEHITPGGERMRAPRFTEATQQLFVLRLQEQQLDAMTASDEAVEHVRRAFEKTARPDVQPERDARQLASLFQQLDQLRDERRRNVIDAEVTEVFQDTQGRAPTST